jgi:hypothetical protein
MVHTIRPWKLFFFILHCIPLLSGIMKETQLLHLLLLPNAIRLLLGNNITEKDLIAAYEKLYRFVWFFEDFYNPEYLSLNVHNLLHLVETVRRHGPLWAYSCFHFEAFNATILAFIQVQIIVNLWRQWVFSNFKSFAVVRIY